MTLGAFALLAGVRAAEIANVTGKQVDLAKAVIANKHPFHTTTQADWREKPVQR